MTQVRAILVGLAASVLALLALAGAAGAAGPSTDLVSLSSTGTKAAGTSLSPAVSSEGRWVAFYSDATNLVSPPSTAGNIFLRDRQRGQTIQVSRGPGGVQPNGSVAAMSMSDDGRLIAFTSSATNLTSPAPPGGYQAYLFDRSTGSIRLVSTNVSSSGYYDTVDDIALSGDGSKLAYTANDYYGTATGRSDVFVVDVASGAATRVAEPTPGNAANGGVYSPALSGDGHYVSYTSGASDLVTGDTNGKADVFLENLDTGARERISVANGGGEANDYSAGSTIDRNACHVAFASDARNLVVGAELSGTKMFVRNRCEGSTEPVSVTNSGTVATAIGKPRISEDGCAVAFSSTAVFTPPAAHRAVALRDRCVGTTSRIDVSSTGDTGNGNALSGIAVGGSAGRYVAFASASTNLSPADTDSNYDVYLRDRDNNQPPTASLTVSLSGSTATADATASSDPDGYQVSGSINFGDGSADTPGLLASHAYAAAGTYLVAVTVTDADGASVRAYKAVTVPNPAPPPEPGPGGTDGLGGTNGGANSSGARRSTPPALRLSGLRLSRTRFAPVPAHGRPTGRQGAMLRLTVNRAATVKLSFARLVAGRRARGRCSATARHGRRCTLLRGAGAMTRGVATGAAGIALTGRIGGRALPPGAYRLRVAVSAGGKVVSTDRRITILPWGAR